MHIEHFAIWTEDIERLLAFYVRYFGATAGARYENPATCFIAVRRLPFAGTLCYTAVGRWGLGAFSAHPQL